MEEIRKRSGEVDGNKLECFFYLLMRDHLSPGIVEIIICNMGDKDTFQFSNGWLAEHAKDVAERLLK